MVAPIKKMANISRLATANLETVAIRYSSHPVLQSLLKEVGAPIVAPSANISGRLTSTTAEHAKKNFPDLMVLDGGPTEKGVESTVVTFSEDILHILRPGAISVEEIEEIASLPTLLATSANKIMSPGQTDRHYAPTLRLRMNAWAPEKEEAFLAFGKNEHPNTTLNLSPLVILKKPQKTFISTYTC